MSSDTMPEELLIVYQDSYLVGVHKPAKMLVHRSDIDRHETINMMTLLREQLGQWVYPVHRLDKPTSGVLLFALDTETARLLTEAFTKHTVSKYYLAVVRGFTKEEGEIDYALKPLWDKMTDKKVSKDKPAQEARTAYKQLAKIEIPYPVGRYDTARYSLLEIQPFTGRQRQIRRHLKHIFHPIVGDTAHGDGKHNLFFREKYNCHRLLLHASKICLSHPITKTNLEIQVPADDSFQKIVRLLVP